MKDIALTLSVRNVGMASPKREMKDVVQLITWNREKQDVRPKPRMFLVQHCSKVKVSGDIVFSSQFSVSSLAAFSLFWIQIGGIYFRVPTCFPVVCKSLTGFFHLHYCLGVIVGYSCHFWLFPKTEICTLWCQTALGSTLLGVLPDIFSILDLLCHPILLKSLSLFKSEICSLWFYLSAKYLSSSRFDICLGKLVFLVWRSV